MNEQERQQAFIQAMQTASQQFGLDLKVTLQTATPGDGEMVIVKPVLTIVAIAGWVEPQINENNETT